MKYWCLFYCIFSSLSLSSFGQQDTTQTEGIKHDWQRNHIGKIFFTATRIANGALHDTLFLDSYTLTNKSDLFFVAFFNNSLTNYKHQLLPNIVADSLFKNGNYQFALFVDGREIYRSNLLPGAPNQQSQDTTTILNRPFIDNVTGQGTWSESFWNRFMNHGGDSVLTEGKHFLQMEIRPYVITDSIHTGPLMASGGVSLQVRRHFKIDFSKIQLNKILPYKGFSVSKEKFDSKKIKELKGYINEGVFKKINSVIVIKNGKLLVEEYFNGETRSTLHDCRSVGKSFISTLLGIAISGGFIKSEKEQLKDFYNIDQFQNYDSLKEMVNIQQLLTMSSGFDGNDEDGNSPGNEEKMYPAPDWVKFTLDLPFQKTMAGQWHYFTAGVILLGDLLNKAVQGSFEKYASSRLFKPLGIQNYKWQYTPQQVPNTAGGIRMNALDFAKYGQLYKNEGVWNGKRIIPRVWVKQTFTKHKQIPGRKNEFYGYLFWNKSFQVKKKFMEAFYCAGNGGNYILIFKDQPLVVVITASAYGQPYAHPQVARMLSDYILPAVIH